MLPHDLGHGHGEDGIEDGVTLCQQPLPSVPGPQILQPAASQDELTQGVVTRQPPSETCHTQ